MYGLKVYITPEDIIDRLSDEDKVKFNQCVFTDVAREADGSITIDCVVFDDQDQYVRAKHRQKYFSEGSIRVSNVLHDRMNTVNQDILSGKGLSKI